MDRLPLSAAQARVAAAWQNARLEVDIDWTKPREEARLFWISVAQESDERHRNALREIACALEAYQSHLDFEAGRAEKKRIVLTRWGDNWHAAIPGETGRDRGRGPSSAIGGLVRSHPELFGVEIVWPEEAK